MEKLKAHYELIAENGSYVTDSKYIRHDGENLKTVLTNMPKLDESGKIPASQLPSYVDDVLEYNNKSSFPATGETGKIYVDLSTNLTYRWSGTTYVEISPSIALGETSTTAYAGNKGKQTADNLAAHIADNVRHITTEEREKWNTATVISMFTAPEKHGAVGDGIADDTNAVQAAINEGGTIILSQKYRVTKTINITKSYTTIQGTGMIYGDLTTDGVILSGYSANVSPVQIDHVTIRDISITQNSANARKHTGISFSHEIQTSVSSYGFMDILIDGVSIEGLTNRGIQIHGGTYQQTGMTRPYVTMQNCYISRCGGIGICQSKVITKIIACTVRLSGLENITIDNGCWQCIVADCTLHLANGGCGNIGIDQCDRCVIIGNHIVNFDYSASSSNDYDNAIRLNCHTGNVTGLIFSNNTIVGGKHGVWIGSSDHNFSGSGTFNNNTFINVGVSDFVFDKAGKCIIKGNNHSKFVNDEWKKAISVIDSDVPVTVPLSECVNDGFSLEGGEIDNKAVITGNYVNLTTKFMHSGKTAGDTPFSLPITNKIGTDSLFQDGHEVCMRLSGAIQIYGDYINMDDDDLVEFSVTLPRIMN